ANNRHQQQQRRDFEGEHVISVQQSSNLLRVTAFDRLRNVLLKKGASLQIHGDQQAAQGQRREGSHQPLLIELFFLLRAVQIHQHDDEQKQHHNSASIKNDLHASDEGRIQHQVQTGLRQQAKDQRQRRVHSVPARDYQDPAEYGQS